MQAILKKIQELYDSLVVRVGNLTREKEAAEVVKADNAKEKSRLADKNVEITEREGAVKKIEDVKKLAEQTKASLEELAGGRNILLRDRNAFDVECEKRKKALRDIEDQMKLKVAALDARDLTLMENEKTYKQKILNNLKDLKV